MAKWESKTIPGRLFEISSSEGPVLRIRGGMMPNIADSNLIASAPELLEALETLVKCYRTGYYLKGGNMPELQHAIEVIRKAKGDHKAERTQKHSPDCAIYSDDIWIERTCDCGGN